MVTITYKQVQLQANMVIFGMMECAKQALHKNDAPRIGGPLG